MGDIFSMTLEDIPVTIHIAGNVIAFSLGICMFARMRPMHVKGSDSDEPSKSTTIKWRNNGYGDLKHCLMGKAFAGSMIISEAVTLFVREASPSSSYFSLSGFGPLHALAAYTVYRIVDALSVLQMNPRPKNWLHRHADGMTFAFLSTVIAGCGVLGRHLDCLRRTGIHWAWFMAGGAVAAIPMMELYRKYLGVTDSDLERK